MENIIVTANKTILKEINIKHEYKDRILTLFKSFIYKCNSKEK